MGIFKKLVGDAISEGISKGVKKAVGDAVEKAVKPAAEKLAEATAKNIEEATEASESIQNSGALSQLKEAAVNYGKQMESLAKELENNEGGLEASIVANNVLTAFPKWEYTPYVSVNTEEEDEYLAIYLSVKRGLTDEISEDLVNKYNQLLEANGFTGDSQLRTKVINGLKHVVDFSFCFDYDDLYLNYYIYKK